MRCAVRSLAFAALAVAAPMALASDGILTFPGAQAPEGPAPQGPQQPSGGQMNAAFVCMAADQSRISLTLDTSGKAVFNDPSTGESAEGTYTYQAATVSLSVPALQFHETTRQIEAAKGLLLAFETSALYCWLLAHEVGEAVQGYVKCPKIGYVPNIGWQENAFEFHSDHSVKWRRWDEYTAIADTTYSESYGTYLIEGDQVSMAFGGRDKERYLTGRIGSGGTLMVAELEPERGACQPQ